MSSKTDVLLTPGQRLRRGLKYTAVGPVDVTRGAVGLTVHGAQSAADRIRHAIDNSRLATEIGEAQNTIAQELAAAQGVLANLPSIIADVRKPKRNRRRPLLLAAVGVVTLAGGAVAFSIVRRSTQPEPSPLPPSVEVAPRP
ncbi:cell wall synthesis protein CwsA [Mycolicibacterium sp. ND9-15]|uniref:cell wall synthesis protein CwsA n=1 Tax=Mycolicibacterium sp. ND9-15 TaxID=3042320 RepID=UPI002DDABD79|nr:cell wall synthesis protein CwsA [Mycolicibacterium sp. ND9-15]WSE58471.1 cell wall synthesis protein CwsA [Mycolicibacterium sp. ND9-15]